MENSHKVLHIIPIHSIGVSKMINIKMQPTDVQALSPKISVIGVGGAGGNAINNMIASNLEGCEFLVCNTDAQALDGSLCENRIQLGVEVTGGLGAGSQPVVGAQAAEESLEEVMKHLEGANMAFVTAGMGGGTGTGAAPVIAKACREKGILTVGVITKPFHFEGTHRMEQAEKGIEEMQEYVDTLIVVPNQNLFRVANEQTTFSEAFKMADTVLQSGVRGVTDLMVRPGLVNLDFADIRTAMLQMGKAMMGTGEATGEKRAIEAAEAAINNPLLDDVSMKGANGVIINVTGGYDMTLFEADEACNRVRDEVDPRANIIFGATFDDSMEGKMRVSIVATGIEREAAIHGGSISGGLKTNAVSSQLLERATPNVSPSIPEVKAEVSPVLATPVPSTEKAINALTGMDAVRQITVPASQEPEVEASMFDQREFSTPTTQEEARNTALRGTRYKNSFIPPAPADGGHVVSKGVGEHISNFHGVDVSETQAPTVTAPIAPAEQQPSAPMQQQMAAPGVIPVVGGGTVQPSTGLQLNPPRQPAVDKKQRSPSLFERITGSVQQHIEGLRDEADASPVQTSGAAQTDPQQGTSPVRGPLLAPSQGSLNIDSPSAKPKGEGDLDIPAFLRRQAN